MTPPMLPAPGRGRNGTPMADDKPVKQLAERKENFARKQAQQGKGLFAGQAPRGSGPPNRHGMPKLPVGQREVTHWPVLDLGDLPAVEPGDWRLEIDGLVEKPLALTWAD